jgi:hypothetical protein
MVGVGVGGVPADKDGSGTGEDGQERMSSRGRVGCHHYILEIGSRPVDVPGVLG